MRRPRLRRPSSPALRQAGSSNAGHWKRRLQTSRPGTSTVTIQEVDGDSKWRRCKDLGEQNSILHQHLESVSTHAARIKQAASSASTEAGEAESTDDDTKLTELRSLVTYLRKEKEIIELQLELGKQENTRLKTQVDHLSQNLDETRQALSEVGPHLFIC